VAVVRRERSTGSVSRNSARGKRVVASGLVRDERRPVGLELGRGDALAVDLGGADDVRGPADRVGDPDGGELLAHAVADEGVLAFRHLVRRCAGGRRGGCRGRGRGLLAGERRWGRRVAATEREHREGAAHHDEQDDRDDDQPASHVAHVADDG
jgi:hypothetical protein